MKISVGSVCVKKVTLGLFQASGILDHLQGGDWRPGLLHVQPGPQVSVILLGVHSQLPLRCLGHCSSVRKVSWVKLPQKRCN